MDDAKTQTAPIDLLPFSKEALDQRPTIIRQQSDQITRHCRIAKVPVKGTIRRWIRELCKSGIHLRQSMAERSKPLASVRLYFSKANTIQPGQKSHKMR